MSTLEIKHTNFHSPIIRTQPKRMESDIKSTEMVE